MLIVKSTVCPVYSNSVLLKDKFSGIGVKHVNCKSLGLFSCREVD